MDMKNLIEKHGDRALPSATYDAPQFIVGQAQDEQGIPINFPLAGGGIVAGYKLLVAVTNKAAPQVEELTDLNLEPGSSLVTITTDMLAHAYYRTRTAARAFSMAQLNGVKNGNAFIVFSILDEGDNLVGISHRMPINLALSPSTTA
ncbi:hypothetical protein [Bordetella flabilis]|uniref:Uncharacterized protein n=2 Tax=Bordetella flabilis TaxID=463014 RepID=A0A193GI60_9BORD|nr:hypothetical protein [Bordetella flabilis]ANN78964.1 hypothetical protein BAU07_19210 [Bordetella flabilis]